MRLFGLKFDSAKFSRAYPFKWRVLIGVQGLIGVAILTYRVNCVERKEERFTIDDVIEKNRPE